MGRGAAAEMQMSGAPGPQHTHGSGAGVQVGEGTDLSSRYAVVVSFGVVLNGTTLDDIARRAGVNATSTDILDTLVRRALPPATARLLRSCTCPPALAHHFLTSFIARPEVRSPSLPAAAICPRLTAALIIL